MKKIVSVSLLLVILFAAVPSFALDKPAAVEFLMIHGAPGDVAAYIAWDMCRRMGGVNSHLYNIAVLEVNRLIPGAGGWGYAGNVLAQAEAHARATVEYEATLENCPSCVR